VVELATARRRIRQQLRGFTHDADVSTHGLMKVKSDKAIAVTSARGERVVRAHGNSETDVEIKSGSTLAVEMTTEGRGPSPNAQDTPIEASAVPEISEHDTLKYHLLGPSLTKAGQDSVDQQKVDLK